MAKPASGATLNTGHALAPSLSAYWPFLEATGSTSSDLKGTKHLTLSGTSWTTDAAGDACVSVASATADACALASALSLDGSASWSLFTRVKQAANDTNGMLWGNNDTAEFGWLNGGTGLTVRSDNLDSSFGNPSVFTTEADYVLTFDHAAGSNRLRLLKNGTEVASSPSNGFATMPLRIACLMAGYSGSTFGFQGTLSCLGIYDGRVIDATEAAALHTDPYQMLTPAGGGGAAVPVFMNQYRQRRN